MKAVFDKQIDGSAHYGDVVLAKVVPVTHGPVLRIIGTEASLAGN